MHRKKTKILMLTLLIIIVSLVTYIYMQSGTDVTYEGTFVNNLFFGKG